jgi:ABC-type nitrate/sulfonate/bicarbonate transport system substrate-binding protein
MSDQTRIPCRPGRRRFLRAAGGGAALMASLAGGWAVAQNTKLGVSVGRQPFAAGNSPITQYMIDNKLFEKQASALGYDITVDWRDYPSAAPMVEAFVSNNLDLGMWGNTPIIRGIAQQQPWTVLNLGEGHMRFVIATRPDSNIRNVQDLKGKTVGTLVGGDPYNVLSQILLNELGSGDPKAFDIKIVNTPTQALAATIPRGMDAAVVIYPAYLKAKKELGIVGIVNSYGFTEDYYKGPAGEGAGKMLESVRKSRFYPEGFYVHRSFWVGQNKLIDVHPKIVVAFLAAQQEAVESLNRMDPGAVSELVKKYWGLPPDDGAKIAKDEVVFIRGWVWPTEGDAVALLETSKFMVEGRIIDKPLTWQQITQNMSKAAPLVRQAYERSGRKPDAAAFNATDAKDLRGLPVWDIAQWKTRS